MLPVPGMESEALTPFSPSLQISALLKRGEKNNEKTRHKCRHPFGTASRYCTTICKWKKCVTFK